MTTNGKCCHIYNCGCKDIRDKLNPLECKSNYSATSNNVKLVHWPLMGWLYTFGTARRRLGGAVAHPVPCSIYQNVTAHPSTASVPMTVLLYNGPLLCGFNVPVKGLINAENS